MIVISQPEFFPEETSLMTQLFDNGLSCLHLRKPNASIDELENFIQGIEMKYHERIVIHSHFQLIQRFTLRGVHFNEKSKVQIPEYATYMGTKSMAVHECDELLNVPQEIDYVLLSPIFPSISKLGYSREWDWGQLKSLLKRARTFQIIALGGITPQNCAKVMDYGFDDFALLGAIWQPLLTGIAVTDILKQYTLSANET